MLVKNFLHMICCNLRSMIGYWDGSLSDGHQSNTLPYMVAEKDIYPYKEDIVNSLRLSDAYMRQ